MGQESAIIDIILLAMIAGFIALRLRSVLGKKTGHERSPEEAAKDTMRTKPSHLHLVADNDDEEEAKAASQSQVSLEGLSKVAQDHLDTIISLEPEFNLSQFMDGAAKAHPMILNSFWLGRMSEVEMFLSKDVYTMFSGAVTAREQEGLTLENKLIETTEKTLADVEVTDRIAKLTVKFVSDIVSVTRDEEGKIVDGDATDAIEVIDIWTFNRELGSKDPNWLLSATRAG